ncbi:MAG: TlpA family protein disulfide reductase [Bdellovibrio sp.]
MKKVVATVTFTLFLFSGLFYLGSLKKTNLFQQEPFAEALVAKNIYGFPVVVNAEKSEFLIFNFWATWCPPCIEETPSLVRFVKKNSGKYRLFSISQDNTLKEIEEFLKTFPDLNNEATEVIWDNSKSISRKMGVSKMPETFIFSVKAKKILKISGSTNWDSSETQNAIDRYFKF